MRLFITGISDQIAVMRVEPMKKMKYLKQIILLLFLMFVGCQKSKDKEKKENLSLLEENKQSDAQYNKSQKNEKSDIVHSVAIAAKKLNTKGRIIASAKEILKDFDHPQFSQKMGKNALDFALEDSRLLFDILKDNRTHWNTDPTLKKSVIGTVSLLTGLIGVPNEETVSGLPDLFINKEYETQRDMLMLQSAKQAVRLAQGRKKVQDEKFSKWLLMAQSSNEITRYTALVLFDLVDPTEEQANSFFDSYSDEVNQTITNLAKQKRTRQ